MDPVSFISDCLEQVQLRLLSTCEGMIQEEVLWRPAPYANNIGFILWHVTRAEDSLVSRLEGGSPTLWVAGGWHKKFGQPVDAPDPLARPTPGLAGDRAGVDHHELLLPVRARTVAVPLDPAPPTEGLPQHLRVVLVGFAAKGEVADASHTRVILPSPQAQVESTSM